MLNAIANLAFNLAFVILAIASLIVSGIIKIERPAKTKERKFLYLKSDSFGDMVYINWLGADMTLEEAVQAFEATKGNPRYAVQHMVVHTYNPAAYAIGTERVPA